jgi:CBS domain containing-hemolysin-like protein
MSLLITAVLLVVVTSAMCSLFEAALYSIPVSHIEQLVHERSRAGVLLQRLREKVDRPITAILSLNTISNTAGAAVAGALAADVLGSQYVIYFSIAFTLAILLFSEIIPKTAGVVFARPLSTIIALPLVILVKVFTPFIFLSGLITHWITGERSAEAISPDEIRVMARLGARSGALDAHEGRVIQNILSLSSKRVRDVMTPRTVVFAMSSSTTVKEAVEELKTFTHSRIPVYDEEVDDASGVIHRRQILEAAAENQTDLKVEALMHPIHFVPRNIGLDRALEQFLEKGQHLFGVVDEYGGLAGVITLEDVLEEILGKEIVDEFDKVADMRELARRRKSRIIAEAERRKRQAEQ